MSGLTTLKLVGSCRIDITGAGTGVFLSNSGAFTGLTVAATVATITTNAAGPQMGLEDVIVATAEGTTVSDPVIDRAFANQIGVRLFDSFPALRTGQVAIDWYRVVKG